MGNISDNTLTVDKSRLWSILVDTLSILGSNSSKAIIYYLNKRSINPENIDMSILKGMLTELFGDGSELLLYEIDRRIRSSQ